MDLLCTNPTMAQTESQKRWAARNPAKVLEYARRYREKHKAKLAAKARERYAADPELFRQRVRDRYVKDHERVREQARQVRRTPHSRASNYEWAERNPEKRRASALLNRAIRSGAVQRGDCEVCGEPNAQGHHDDYSKPYDVRWLCAVHHMAVHHARGPSRVLTTSEDK